jgi:hypothetical protein
MIVAAIGLAGVLLCDSRSLARGGGGSHGGGSWGGHGGGMNGFSMHGPAMGRHDHGERERPDQHNRFGRRDDRDDRFEHRRDHRPAHWDDHHWHRFHGFGDMGRDGPHPQGIWSRGSGFGDGRRGRTTADGQWQVENP